MLNTEGPQDEDITPLIAWRREAWKEEALDDLPWKDTRDGHRQSDEHWNSFKGNVGETSERRGGAYMGAEPSVCNCSDRTGILQGVLMSWSARMVGPSPAGDWNWNWEHWPDELLSLGTVSHFSFHFGFSYHSSITSPCMFNVNLYPFYTSIK